MQSEKNSPIKEKLFSRLTLVFLLLFIQGAWFAVFFLRLVQYSDRIQFGFSIVSALVVLGLISSDDHPEYKTGWIVLTMALPIFGTLFYLLFQNQWGSRKLQKRLDEATLVSQSREQMIRSSPTSVLSSKRHRSTAHYLATEGYPLFQDTDLTYYSVGEHLFQDMIEQLKQAKHFIFIEFFIIAEGQLWDEILDILKEKTKQGVDVRIIYDELGSYGRIPDRFDQHLEKMGIRCLSFNRPVPFLSAVINNRNHRKIVAIDGVVAYNGGVNLADEYINVNSPYGHWKDTGLKLKGAAAGQFAEMFLIQWRAFREEKDPDYQTEEQNDLSKKVGAVQPYDTSPLSDSLTGVDPYIEIIDSATEYVYIFTPYLIIDSRLRSSLILAAKRGVDVRIITPGIPDKKIVYRLTRSNYPPLLEQGIRIFEYSPGFLHAKSMVSDDRIGVVGTINLDYRSLYLHFECATLLYEDPILEAIEQDFMETQKRSREIKKVARKPLARLIDAVLRVFAPLF